MFWVFGLWIRCKSMAYFVYILKCKDGTFYTGSTDNIEKRLQAHNDKKTGARYTKSRRPVVLAYTETFETKSQALKREMAIKKLTRKSKRSLVA